MKFIYETDRLILKLLGENDAPCSSSVLSSRTGMSLSHMKPYTGAVLYGGLPADPDEL